MREYFKHNHPSYIAKHAFGFALGFALSPLSWWNDIFINVPLAWIMTWPILKLTSLITPVSTNLFLAVFIINYWITNIIGMIMMHRSGKKLINNETKIDIIKDLYIAIIYSVIVAIIFLANPNDILNTLKIIPPWVN